MERERAVEINLIDLFFYVRKRVWIIILAAIVCAGAAFAVCKLYMTPQYVATTTAYILKKDAEGNKDVAYSDLQLAAQLAKDYQALIKTRTVASKVIETLGLNMSSSKLLGKLTVSSPGSSDTRILNISVRDEDPELAARIADCVREVAATELQRIMDTESLRTVDEAVVPTVPSSPAIKSNTLKGGLLGGAAAFAVIFIFFMLDDRIKTEEDVERYLQLNTVGTIPYCPELETVKTGDNKPGKNAPSKKKEEKNEKEENKEKKETNEKKTAQGSAGRKLRMSKPRK